MKVIFKHKDTIIKELEDTYDNLVSLPDEEFIKPTEGFKIISLSFVQNVLEPNQNDGILNILEKLSEFKRLDDEMVSIIIELK